MTVKSLRKQLAAAIAMTLVATVALGSSTYAWFVSNNTVKATTASISAQSNAPFLKIAKRGDALVNTAATQVAGASDKVVLYPAQWNNVIDENTYQFESAYASAATEATMLANSRFAVGGVNAEKRPDYALMQSFDIGTTDANAGSFQNLKVAAVEIVNAANTGTSEETDITGAICVLVKCGDNWGVYRATNDGTELTAYGDSTTVTNNLTGKDGTGVTDALVATIAANSYVTVDVYVFYDGSQTDVYSNNLANLGSCGVTVTFTATPVNTDGNAVDAPNVVTTP